MSLKMATYAASNYIHGVLEVRTQYIGDPGNVHVQRQTVVQNMDATCACLSTVHNMRNLKSSPDIRTSQCFWTHSYTVVALSTITSNMGTSEHQPGWCGWEAAKYQAKRDLAGKVSYRRPLEH